MNLKCEQCANTATTPDTSKGQRCECGAGRYWSYSATLFIQHQRKRFNRGRRPRVSPLSHAHAVCELLLSVRTIVHAEIGAVPRSFKNNPLSVRLVLVSALTFDEFVERSAAEAMGESGAMARSCTCVRVENPLCAEHGAKGYDVRASTKVAGGGPRCTCEPSSPYITTAHCAYHGYSAYYPCSCPRTENGRRAHSYGCYVHG